MRKHAGNYLIVIAISVAIANCLVGFEGVELKTFTTEYDSFTRSEMFAFVGAATVSNEALQLTPDTVSDTKTIRYNSGRVLLKHPFRVWEDNGGGASMVASFNTSFLVNVFSISGGASEGLAFVIAPDLLLPPNSFGPFLGLTSAMTDGNDANKLVAVELDAVREDFDPDNNHVGINVNSVRSIKTEYLTPHNISIFTEAARFYNVWVDYDGLTIDVYIAEQAGVRDATPPKPASAMLSAPVNLRDHVLQHSYFGFSASTGYTSALNCVLRWNLTVHHFPSPDTSISPLVWIGVVAVVVVVLSGAAGVGYRFYNQKAKSPATVLVQTLNRLPGMPREFRFRDLKKATSNFNEMNKLGKGGFGVVYRGLLAKENVEIAVKQFSRETIKSQHDFIAELTVINRLRHKHLVKLLGWCNKRGKLLLVYEYMPNSSLDRHLFVGPNKVPLSWNLRLKIINGVASALHYLHNDYDHRVIHRDLKASNIMLDHDFNARLGDFGLAKVLDNEKTSYAETEGVMGTMGYIAPECLLTGKTTRQTDVYAFGAVLLEVVCGQRPGTKIAGFNFLVDWVWMLYRDDKLVEAVDEKLGDEYVDEEARMLLLLGLACSHPNGSERPETENILKILSGTMPAPAIPFFKPAFLWDAVAVPLNVEGVMDENSLNTMTITVSDLAR